MMWNYIAIGFVAAGIVALGGGLLVNRKLVASFPKGALRRQWYGLMALEAGFIVGYIAHLFLTPNTRSGVADLMVPTIFLFGGGFVWANARLSLRTAEGVRTIARLQMEAATDPLTSLFNRRSLDRRLGEEVSGAERRGGHLSVLMVDLDHFKRVNDRFGHQVGDVVLVKLAAVLRSCLRASDFVARYGGEEFVVVLPDAGIAQAAQLAERIRVAVANHDFDLPTAITPAMTGITVSVGVAGFSQDQRTAEAILQAADRSLYQAKRLGRNRVATADSGVRTLAPRTASGASAA